MISIANGGGLNPGGNIIGCDFLHLVRLGIRDANDPIAHASIEVIDRVVKRNLPQGPCWRRYNHDGYGQKDDGSAFDGTGVGRSWPVLTGERGHYELAAGRDPMPWIMAMEKFANEGGMITEQLWDADDLPDGSMKRGRPTGAAMPLCWSHAEAAAGSGPSHRLKDKRLPFGNFDRGVLRRNQFGVRVRQELLSLPNKGAKRAHPRPKTGKQKYTHEPSLHSSVRIALRRFVFG